MAFNVTPPAGESVATMRAVATVGGREVASGMETIDYPHIPDPDPVPALDHQARANRHQGDREEGRVHHGRGRRNARRSAQLGVEVTLLSDTDLAQGDLSRYDAIVAGVRGYNVRTAIRADQPRLMKYVENGGTYIVQYNTAEGGGPGGPGGPGGGGRGGPQPAPGAQQPPPQQAPVARTSIGPYPISVPGGNQWRITVEDAPVTFPHPDSRLLQYPNHINPKDFEGWVQERGLYFSTQWDPKYETVISATDPGEKPQEGGQLWTRYGKGVYIFTAYSWFRQLPAGVPGAYRMFANLLSAK